MEDEIPDDTKCSRIAEDRYGDQRRLDEAVLRGMAERSGEE